MGQSFSSGNHIFIQVDRPYYSPGDPVNGQVMLNCVTPFQASALVLKIEGYERTRWEERQERTSFEGSDNRSVTRETIYPHSGKKDIFKIKIPLQIYSQNVQPGQYQFPFGCILPLGLPGSFEYSANNLYYQGNQHNYLKAKIRYKVKAECEIPGMLKHNLRAKQHLTVLQRMERPPSQVVVEDRQSVKACCCCDKGYAYITAHVEKDSYFPGETVNVILQIDNQSTAEFSSVQLQLHRTLRLRSDGAGQHESDEKLAESKMPGVKAGEKQMGKDGARRISLQLPSALQSGASGQLVECIYTLEVKLKASSFMSDPTLKLPIMIYQAIPQYQAYAAPPPFWQPAVVPPPVQVEIPSAPPMPPMGQVMGVPAPSKYEPPQPTYGGSQ